jgi:hypothetical protein
MSQMRAGGAPRHQFRGRCQLVAAEQPALAHRRARGRARPGFAHANGGNPRGFAASRGMRPPIVPGRCLLRPRRCSSDAVRSTRAGRSAESGRRSLDTPEERARATAAFAVAAPRPRGSNPGGALASPSPSPGGGEQRGLVLRRKPRAGFCWLQFASAAPSWGRCPRADAMKSARFSAGPVGACGDAVDDALRVVRRREDASSAEAVAARRLRRPVPAGRARRGVR